MPSEDEMRTIKAGTSPSEVSFDRSRKCQVFIDGTSNTDYLGGRMGTNFYWNDPEVKTFSALDDDEKIDLLRDTIRDYLGAEATQVDLQAAFHRTAPDLQETTEGEGRHIGKRSAAGPYCYDCDVTLCPGGKDRVHMGRMGDVWPDHCPKCGKTKTDESLDEGAVGVELGFATAKTTRPTGVRSCSSFSWAQQPAEVIARCNENPDDEIIQDEYGRRLTGREFLGMLEANCPIRFTHSIGKDFC